MNLADSNISEPDEPAGEASLQRAMTGLPLPETPGTLAQQTRRRVQNRRTRRRAIFGASVVVVLLAGVLISRPWNRFGAPGLPGKPNALQARATNEPGTKQPVAEEPSGTTLDSDTLESLFALPPVDSLAVLDRRLGIEARVLDRKEQRQ